MGWRLRTILTIREKKPITLRTMFRSPHDARAFEQVLRLRIGVSQSIAQPNKPVDVTKGAMCRYHPDTVAEYECVGCHKRFCSKCIKEFSGENYCNTCASRAKRKVRHRVYTLPKDAMESVRQAMLYDPYKARSGGEKTEAPEANAGQSADTTEEAS